jgi:hypothetical protein
MKPLLFNGALYEHWNTDDLVGNKYSMVFFPVKPKKNTNKKKVVEDSEESD